MEMDQEKLQVFREDFALLVEAGFIAVKQLDEVSATRIFNALQILNPQQTVSRIGMGYIALNKLEIKQATQIFESVLEIEAENHLAQVFLGMCFLLTKGKQQKGEKLIQSAMEKAEDPTVKNLGAICLEWSKKDLSKKNQVPFFLQEKDSEEK
jgi:hypothetical protein